MRLQPNRNYVSNDDIQTPPALARRLVEHFQPTGRILEPCAGDGNFLRALRSHVRSARAGTQQPAPRIFWCELKKNRDFFACQQRVDWIITNPPWSQVRRFLQQSLQLADNVVFLFTLNHLWTRARLSDIRRAGFGLKEMVLLDNPDTFPPMGFQLGAVHLSRAWTNPVTLTDWTSLVEDGARGEPGGPSDGEAVERRSTVDGGRSDVDRAAEVADPELEEIRAINRRLDALLSTRDRR